MDKGTALILLAVLAVIGIPGGIIARNEYVRNREEAARFAAVKAEQEAQTKVLDEYLAFSRQPPAIRVDWGWRLRRDNFTVCDGKVTNVGPETLRGTIVIFTRLTDDGREIDSNPGTLFEDPLFSGDSTYFEIIAPHHSRTASGRIDFMSADGKRVRFEIVKTTDTEGK